MAKPAPETKPVPENANPTEPEPGPVAREEVRVRGRTFAIGERLPGDLPAEQLARLKQLGCI